MQQHKRYKKEKKKADEIGFKTVKSIKFLHGINYTCSRMSMSLGEIQLNNSLYLIRETCRTHL